MDTTFSSGHEWVKKNFLSATNGVCVKRWHCENCGTWSDSTWAPARHTVTWDPNIGRWIPCELIVLNEVDRS